MVIKGNRGFGGGQAVEGKWPLLGEGGQRGEGVLLGQLQLLAEGVKVPGKVCSAKEDEDKLEVLRFKE